MANRIMLKVSNNSGKFVEMRTYSRELGRKGRFYVQVEDLINWIANPQSMFMDADCGSFLRMWNTHGSTGKELFCLEFTWLRECGHVIGGYRQCIRIDADAFRNAIQQKGEMALLDVQGGICDGIVEVTESARAEAAHLNKRQRRAFCKAVYKVQYPQECTLICADGKKDFFFRCASGMVGGLVLHKKTDGSVYYGVHT